VGGKAKAGQGAPPWGRCERKRKRKWRRFVVGSGFVVVVVVVAFFFFLFLLLYSRLIINTTASINNRLLRLGRPSAEPGADRRALPRPDLARRRRRRARLGAPGALPRARAREGRVAELVAGEVEGGLRRRYRRGRAR
jgi:hypothetical protein